MTATETNELVVVSIGWDDVTVAVNGGNKRMSWDILRAAAGQDDAGLRVVYAGVLAEAAKMARSRRAIKVTASNMSGHDSDAGALTWAATLHTMSGEFVSGRTVAADWGGTGSKSHAIREAAEARTALAAKGYEVR